MRGFKVSAPSQTLFQVFGPFFLAASARSRFFLRGVLCCCGGRFRLLVGAVVVRRIRSAASPLPVERLFSHVEPPRAHRLAPVCVQRSGLGAPIAFEVVSPLTFLQICMGFVFSFWHAVSCPSFEAGKVFLPLVIFCRRCLVPFVDRLPFF